MKRFLVPVFGILLLFLGFMLSGCGATGPDAAMSPSPWSIATNSYHTANRIDDAVTSGYFYYEPDPGYQWLVINVTVHNNLQSDNSLNWLLDAIYYVSANGNKYSQHLVWNTPVNQLPTSYNPQQEQSGDIFFEVPLGENISAGKLLVHFSGQSDSIIDMSAVPYK